MLLHKGKLKICDFGLSRNGLSRNGLSKNGLSRKTKVGKKLTTAVGNLISGLTSQQYDCKTDILSLGINVYWIAFGSFPLDE